VALFSRNAVYRNFLMNATISSIAMVASLMVIPSGILQNLAAPASHWSRKAAMDVLKSNTSFFNLPRNRCRFLKTKLNN